MDNSQAQRAVHKTTFQKMPPHIREQVLHTDTAARGKGLTGKGVEPFGEVIQEQVDVLETADGTTSYTLGMEKMADGPYMDNLVVTEDVDGILDSHILRYRPSDGWLAGRASGGMGWEAYSGEIFIFDGEGNPKAAGQFDDGNVTGQATGTGMAGKSDEMDCTLINVSYGGLEQDGVFYVTDIIIDYECSGSGTNGGVDGPGTDNGGGQFPQGGGQPHGGGGGSSGGGGGNQIPTLVDNRLFFENIVVDESVDPCVVGIINKLALKDMQRLTVPDIGQLDGTGHLSQGILDLFDSSGNYDLVFKVEEAGHSNGVPRNAFTQKTIGKSEWTITLDDDYVRKATQLSIARTIIHESVHAFIGYTLNVNRNSDLSTNIREYYNNLGAQQTLNSGVQINLTEHEFIGQYVQGIAKSLSFWDNGRQSQNYYIKLAWAGLETSSAFQAQPKKADIQNAINNEQTANNNAKGEKCP